MSLDVGVSKRALSNWTCERKVHEPPACRESEKGEYLAGKYCEQECESVAVAQERLNELVQLFNSHDEAPFTMNFSLTLKDTRYQKNGSVDLNHWKIDLKCLEFCYGEHENCTFRYSSVENSFVLDHFAPLTHASLVMKIVKLICAACAMARKEKVIQIKLIDASVDKTGVSMFPWLKLARGYSYYEARGFTPDPECSEMPSRKALEGLQKETFKTFVESMENRYQGTFENDEILQMTLKNVGDWFLGNVKAYDQFLSKGGAAVETALNDRLLCAHGYVFKANLKEAEGVASVGGFGKYAVAWNLPNEGASFCEQN